MTSNPVVLINTFAVPDGEEDRFLHGWEQARDVLMAQDGYLSSQLHQSIGTDSQRRFVDVGTWASEAAFHQAIEKPEFRSLDLPYRIDDSLYRVVRADQHWDAESAALRRAYAAARN